MLGPPDADTDGNEVWASVADVLPTQLTEAVWMSTFTNVLPIRAGDRTVRLKFGDSESAFRAFLAANRLAGAVD